MNPIPMTKEEFIEAFRDIWGKEGPGEAGLWWDDNFRSCGRDCDFPYFHVRPDGSRFTYGMFLGETSIPDGEKGNDPALLDGLLSDGPTMRCYVMEAIRDQEHTEVACASDPRELVRMAAKMAGRDSNCSN